MIDVSVTCQSIKPVEKHKRALLYQKYKTKWACQIINLLENMIKIALLYCIISLEIKLLYTT